MSEAEFDSGDHLVDLIAKAVVTAYGEDAEKDCPCEQDMDVARGVSSVVAPLLAEAERRGAEKGCEERDALRAKVARVEALAAGMRNWCSPYGIAVTYSQRITDALEGQ